MKVGLILSKLPYPKTDGTTISYYNHLRLFKSLGYDVDLYSLGSDPSETALMHLQSLCSSVTVFPVPKRYVAPLRRPNLPWSVSAKTSSDLIYRLKKDLRSLRWDVVLVESPPMEAEILELLYGQVGVILRTNDLAYDAYSRIASEMRAGPRRLLYALEGRRLKAYQHSVNRSGCFDINMFSRDDDRQLMANAYPNNALKFKWVPLWIDHRLFEQRGVRSAAVSQMKASGKIVLFTGSMSYRPNALAALRFADSIWPEIKARFRGKAYFVIAGKDPPLSICGLSKGDPSIFVTGTLSESEMMDYFRVADICVIPVESGSGFRYKAVQALAARHLVISTSFAVKGMGLQDGEHVMVADDPKSFCDICVSALNNPEQYSSIVARGYEFVLENYTLQRVKSQIALIFEKVAHHDA
jgi:glycosyltransferase involved in cell wall biosynthesis